MDATDDLGRIIKLSQTTPAELETMRHRILAGTDSMVYVGKRSRLRGLWYRIRDRIR